MPAQAGIHATLQALIDSGVDPAFTPEAALRHEARVTSYRFQQHVPLLPSELDDAVTHLRAVSSPVILRNDDVIDAQAAAGDLAPRLAVGLDEAGA